MRRKVLIIALLVGLAGWWTLMGETHGQRKPVVKFAYTNDPVYEVFVYALKEGKVTSPRVEVESIPLDIGALNQALGTKQYDLVEVTALGVPIARSRGLDVVIVGTGGVVRGGRFIFVKKDSSISSPRDLKGKTVGVMALASTAVAHMRIVLSRKYGLNTDLRAGDVKWAEIPLPMLPAALERGGVDAAFLFHTPGFKSMSSGEFRIINDVIKDYVEVFGLAPLVSVVVSYEDKVKRSPDTLREALKLIRASARYPREHAEEVYSEVARRTKLPVDALKKLAGEWYEFNSTLEEREQRAIKNMWEVGKEMRIIENYPDLKGVIWE